MSLPDLTPAIVGLEGRSYVRLVYIGVTPPIRVCDGVGNFRTPADDLHDPSAIYVGAPALRDLPEFERSFEAKAQTVEFEINVISPRLLDLYSRDVVGLEVRVGDMYFDRNLQQAANIDWDWYAELNTPRLVTSAKEKTLYLSATSGIPGRRRKGMDVWSKLGHRADHPTDAFCDNTGLYNINTARIFP